MMKSLSTNAKQRQTLPSVKVKGYSKANEHLIRVDLDVVHTSESRTRHQQVASAVRELFDNKIRPVEGTFQSVSSSGLYESISGFMAPNAEAVVLEGEEIPQHFKSLSKDSNLYMDNEDSMWQLHRSSAGNLMVKANSTQTSNAMIEMIEQVCSGQLSMSSAYAEHQCKVDSVRMSACSGDFVQFIDKNYNAGIGFIVATASDTEQAIVLDIAGNDHIIDRGAVTQVYELHNQPQLSLSAEEELQMSISAARGTTSVQRLLDYYKRVYAYAPAYYEEVAKRIKSYQFM